MGQPGEATGTLTICSDYLVWRTAFTRPWVAWPHNISIRNSFRTNHNALRFAPNCEIAIHHSVWKKVYSATARQSGFPFDAFLIFA
jgi:hypothetical protein